MGKLKRWKTACAVWVFCAATAIALPAQTFATLHVFDGYDGAHPYPAPLVEATDGNLYGTTSADGPNGGNYGTVFQITPSGTLTTIYGFCSQSGCTDGNGPNGVIQAADGNFYGTTGAGGANGDGTVFKITPGGALTTLHSFDGTDGELPFGLVQATDGNFYGTTALGGDTSCNPTTGCGTVFQITPSGTLTTLHAFSVAEGGLPLGGLVQATDGNFYGTTSSGGPTGNGTVFKITPSGTLTTIYSFCSQVGCTDGREVYGALIQAADGNLYGTTYIGGANSPYCPNGSYGCGTVFQITLGGTLTRCIAFARKTAAPTASPPARGWSRPLLTGTSTGRLRMAGTSAPATSGAAQFSESPPPARWRLSTAFAHKAVAPTALYPGLRWSRIPTMGTSTGQRSVTMSRAALLLERSSACLWVPPSAWLPEC